MRLFVAAEVPAEARAAVDAAVAPLRPRWPDLRWIDPDRWHVTLVFLGDVPDDRTAALSAALEGAASACAPAPVVVAPEATRTRTGVLWVAVTGAALAALAGRLRAAAAAAGCNVEDRPFRGHLTLARARGRGRVPAAAASAYAGPAVGWTVRSVLLLHSQLGGGRPARYATVSAHPLGG